jgi:1-phosphofructokinase
VIITLTPNPSIDRTLEIPALVPGHVHRATGEHQEPSGKGVNVSRALTSNGVANVAILPLGGAEGEQLRSLLAAEGVNFDVVAIRGSVRVNISLTEPDGHATKINAVGPQLSPAELEALTQALIDRVQPGDWVVASGSLPRGVGDSYYAHVCQLVHRAGARFALDSSGPSLAQGLPAEPDVVKPNIEELEGLVGRHLDTLHDVVNAARELLERGAHTALVSMGPDGALLVCPATVVKGFALAVNARSTIGAGDALLAGFIAAGGGGQKALREALAWGTAAVSVEGSHVPVITDHDRAAVRIDTDPDLSQRLHRPTASTTRRSA